MRTNNDLFNTFPKGKRLLLDILLDTPFTLRINNKKNIITVGNLLIMESKVIQY